MKPRPLKVRFEEKYIPEPNSGCWLWTAALDDDGYGKHKGTSGKMNFAHRVSWEVYRGPVPSGMCVLHQCDNPPCVNPEHLFIGTHQDNIRDKMQKGRHRAPRGSQQGSARLHETDIPIILADPRQSKFIAKDYNVSPRTIRDVKNNKTWNWL